MYHNLGQKTWRFTDRGTSDHDIVDHFWDCEQPDLGPRLVEPVGGPDFGPNVNLVRLAV